MYSCTEKTAMRFMAPSETHTASVIG
jgi:hypothetical protein